MKMTLDEYHTQVLANLQSCRDPAQARTLMHEVDAALTRDRISQSTQRVFWGSLGNALEELAQETTRMPDRRAATALIAVVVAAQSLIEQYQLRNASGSPGS